ncbi:MAG: minor capsid protein [Candidatus Marinimicrobia bacterium]|nr:minor capsid protein [Candidatus Neomarinimicrobiota bacterium]
MTLKKVDEDICQYLDDQGIVTYNQPLNSNMFIGLPRPVKTDSNGNYLIPIKSAWIIIQVGPEPQRVFGHDYRVHQIAFQVLIRGEPNKSLNTRDFAEDIWNALEGAQPTGYFHILAQQSGPIPIGNDDNDNPMYSLNFIAEYQEDL